MSARDIGYKAGQLGSIPVLIVLLRCAVLRVHDMGKTAHVVVGIFAATCAARLLSFFSEATAITMLDNFMNLAMFVLSIVLMAARGTKGENQYGNQPAQGHIAGLIIMIALTAVTALITVLAFIRAGQM
jgi:uncharacterized membrane protein YhaH (DUF805 family)